MEKHGHRQLLLTISTSSDFSQHIFHKNFLEYLLAHEEQAKIFIIIILWKYFDRFLLKLCNLQIISSRKDAAADYLSFLEPQHLPSPNGKPSETWILDSAEFPYLPGQDIRMNLNCISLNLFRWYFLSMLPVYPACKLVPPLLRCEVMPQILSIPLSSPARAAPPRTAQPLALVTSHHCNVANKMH